LRNETQQIQNVGFHFVQPNLHGGPNDDQGLIFDDAETILECVLSHVIKKNDGLTRANRAQRLKQVMIL